MRTSRRTFMQASIAAGMAAFLTGNVLPQRIEQAYAATKPLDQWIDPLPIPPVATPIPNAAYPGADYYVIPMAQGMHKFHAQFPAVPSWGYGGAAYLGPTIVAQRGRPVVVRYVNRLPATHLLQSSVDPTIVRDPEDPPMLMTLPPTRAVAHLHGGFTAPQFDGHPDSWFTNNSVARARGSAYDSLPGAAANEAIFRYTNAQPAAMLWYHDHAMGITRLNVYAGLAAVYLLRDSTDTGNPNRGLNLPKGAYEVPLVIQDKTFNLNGTPFYPTTSGVPAPYPHPAWVPEFFGDTPVVNGKAYPYLAVEPRRYRLRLLNGSQARFYQLSLSGGLPMWVIGTEGGLLPKAVQLKAAVLAPGERLDVIVDFSKMAGAKVTLTNSAAVPYPGGGAQPAGPRINQIMQFRVSLPLTGTDLTTLPAQLPLPAVTRLIPGPVKREIVLKETMDVATGTPLHVRLNERWFGEPVEEMPHAGDTETWQFINVTGDAHPMHLHLVQFQVLDRQPIAAAAYSTAYLTWVAAGRDPATKPVLSQFLAGSAVPAPPEEAGWKDTVQSLPGEVTRVVARFDVPPSTALPADYVYHCHILEHEENEMMRPFRVMP